MKLSEDELNAITKIKKENPDNYIEELKSYLFCRYVIDITTMSRCSDLIPIFYAGKQNLNPNELDDFDGDLISMIDPFKINQVYGSFGNGDFNFNKDVGNEVSDISKRSSDSRIKENSEFSHVTKVDKENGIIEVLWVEEDQIVPGETIELHRRPYSVEDFSIQERRKKGIVTEIIKKEYNRLLVSAVVLGREIDFEINDIVIKSGVIPMPIIHTGINTIINHSWREYDNKPVSIFIDKWVGYTHYLMGNVKSSYIYIDKNALPNEIKNRLIKILNGRNIKFTSWELNSYFQIIKKHGRIHKNEIKGYRDERRY